MSAQAWSFVVKHSEHKGGALLLLLMIANHAHADGSNAYPTVKTLAAECRMSVRQVIRLVAQLEKSGELIVERSKGRHHHNYAINMNLNRDKKSELNDDKMSQLTLTSETPNPDICDTPTLTNRARHYINHSIEPSEGTAPAKSLHLIEKKMRPEEEENIWLDAVANLIGAKSRHTLADAHSWRSTIATAIAEGRSVKDFLDVTTDELERTRSTPQFFTPKAVLRILQTSSAPRIEKPNKKFALNV
jgi:hypothetical protein